MEQELKKLIFGKAYTIDQLAYILKIFDFENIEDVLDSEEITKVIRQGYVIVSNEARKKIKIYFSFVFNLTDEAVLRITRIKDVN